MSKPTFSITYPTLEKAEQKVAWLLRELSYVGFIKKVDGGYSVTWTRTDHI
jgi:hypothetical protein